MNRFRRTLALVVVAIAASSGCINMGPGLSPFIPSTDHAPDVTARQVVVIGDSLSAEAETLAKARWKAVPDTDVSYQAFGGTQFQHWMERLPEIPEGATVEMLLGTNDAGNLTVAQAVANARAAFDLLATRQPSCVVWFRLNTTSANLRTPEVRARILAFNTQMAAIVASGQYPFLVEQRWDLTSAGHTSWLKLPDDPIHHTPAGATAYVNEQVEALNRCPAQQLPEPTTTTTVAPTTTTTIEATPTTSETLPNTAARAA